MSNKYKNQNSFNGPMSLPAVVYAKIFGYNFILFILFLGLSMSMIFNIGVINALSYFKYQINDISVLRYFLIIFIIILLAIYEFIIWIYILLDKKYIKFTNEEIIYKGAFKSKLISIKDIEKVKK